MALESNPEVAVVGHDHGHGHGRPDRISGSEHVKHPPLITYVIVYFLLLLLLVVTVGLYYIDLQKIFTFIPGVNLIVALIVAVVKASLVVMFFMNVKGGTKLTVLWAVLGFIWLLFMGGIFMDYQSRHWIDQSGWQMTGEGH